MIENLENIIGGFEKGQYITPEILENFVGFERATSDYYFKTISIASYIKKILSERGNPVTLEFNHYGIKILTDKEASAYNARKALKGLRILDQAHQDLNNVDANELQPDEEKRHNERIIIVSRANSAVKQELTKDMPVKLDSYKSNLPRLFK